MGRSVSNELPPPSEPGDHDCIWSWEPLSFDEDGEGPAEPWQVAPATYEHFTLLRNGEPIATLHVPVVPGVFTSLIRANDPYDGPPQWVWCFKDGEAAVFLRGVGVPSVWLFPPEDTDPRVVVGAAPPSLEYGNLVVRFPVVPDTAGPGLTADPNRPHHGGG